MVCTERPKGKRVIKRPGQWPTATRALRSYMFSFEAGENVNISFGFEPKKNFSEFFKLNLFVFVRYRGKYKHFALRFVAKNVSETGAP